MSTSERSPSKVWQKRLAVVAGLVSLAILCAVLVHKKDGSASATPESAASLAITAGTAKEEGLGVSAWLTYWDDGSGLSSLKQNVKKLSSLHLFWYEARSATDIHRQGNASPSAAISLAKKHKLPVIATVTEKLSAASFLALLNDDEQRNSHVHSLCTFATTNEFAGLDLDYENMAVGTAPDQVRGLSTGYSLLVTDLASCLHAKHKTLEVTVNAKTSDALFGIGSDPLATGVYDYKALGKAADVVHLMAYDYHYSGGTAGPVDPLPWVEDVVRYATKNIDAKKVQLAVALYGYDWQDGKTGGKVVTSSQAITLMNRYGVTPVMDQSSQTMVFGYAKDGLSRHVWYDDSNTINLRVKLASQYELGGVVFWALGDEDQSLWQ